MLGSSEASEVQRCQNDLYMYCETKDSDGVNLWDVDSVECNLEISDNLVTTFTSSK